MKKQLLLLSVLLTMGAVLSLGCMDREPAPVCPVPTELKKSDPGVGKYDGVDILVVVDNSGSMAEEQQILATSFFPLVNSLVNPVPGWPFDASSNIRIAVTTSDLGVSYDGKLYEGPDNEKLFDNDRVRCHKDGDGGEFISEYRTGNSVTIQEGVIQCGTRAEDHQCPSGWSCQDVNDEGVGVCMAPGGELTVDCPRSPEESDISYIENDVTDKATAVACLAQVGTEGCNYEQQLMAGAFGLEKTLTGDGKSFFMRKTSLTTILIVSDEEDCSLKSDEWHGLKELGDTDANVACGRHEKDMLFKVEEIKERYDQARFDATGDVGGDGVVFAAIVGVPYKTDVKDGENPLTACEGIGRDLGKCADVKPGVNGTGTMAAPEEVDRVLSATQTQTYYEYACTRTEGTEEVTKAYPGMRYVELAQAYNDKGYVYSICHDDWSPAMQEIAKLIAEEMGGTCYTKRLSWNPKDETAECNVVFDYFWKKSEHKTAPECPTNASQKWESKTGELTQVSLKSGDGYEAYWKRSCTLQKLSAPINCPDIYKMSEEDQKKYTDENAFGWYYCENTGEDNSVACNDNLDNDRDGFIDEKDSDCVFCTGEDTTKCKKDCPYKVSLTPGALREVVAAETKVETNVVCLQQYRFEDPNCKENTADSCQDGEDNDGNGPYDCWSYSKKDDEEGRIKKEHYPKQGARNADPDCCPMIADENGNCQFLDMRSHPAPLSKGSFAYMAACGVKSGPEAMPDSCCEQATALLCRLDEAYKAECDSREGN
ncbi:MAG: hypothetical protein JXR76_05125 [Deltaproteobacteria bacterium]|nr:hypothetical protein [Deltaproteobacteria bacterium]